MKEIVLEDALGVAADGFAFSAGSKALMGGILVLVIGGSIQCSIECVHSNAPSNVPSNVPHSYAPSHMLLSNAPSELHRMLHLICSI